MDGDFEELINELKGYEKEIDLLWKEYNQNDSCLKMELLAMKMGIVFYKYIIACLETLNDTYSERFLYLIKKSLTIITYGLTGVSLIKAPVLSLPGFLGSLSLTFKNLRYKENANSCCSEEQLNELLDLLDKFENYYADRIDIIMEQIDKYEDDQILNKMEQSERNKRIVCKKLMQFLRLENNELLIEDEKFMTDLKEILKDSFENENNDVFELLQGAENYYNQLDLKLTKLSKKQIRQSNLFKIIS